MEDIASQHHGGFFRNDLLTVIASFIEDPIQDMMKEMMARIQKGIQLKSSKVAMPVFTMKKYPSSSEHF